MDISSETYLNNLKKLRFSNCSRISGNDCSDQCYDDLICFQGKNVCLQFEFYDIEKPEDFAYENQ